MNIKFDELLIEIDNSLQEQEMFQKHLCPPWCKIHVYKIFSVEAKPVQSK